MVKINGDVFGGIEDCFPNGEVCYKELNLSDTCNVVSVQFRTNKDIADCMFAAEYVKSQKENAEQLVLEMHYVPYSRMDREINNQIFSMRLLARIVAKMNFTDVFILDPHSEVCVKEFEDAGVNVVVQRELLEVTLRYAIDYYKPDVLFLPDKGAYNKYVPIIKEATKIIGERLQKLPILHGNKVRDTLNKGRIKSDEYEVVNEDKVDIKGKRVLIIDDICSFGGTALTAAAKLREMEVANVGLYITHAEYSIGGGNVFKSGLINEVYTTTSIIKHDYSSGVMAEDIADPFAMEIAVAVYRGKLTIIDIKS